MEPGTQSCGQRLLSGGDAPDEFSDDEEIFIDFWDESEDDETSNENR